MMGISVYRHPVRNAGPLCGSDCLQLRAPTRRHEKSHSRVQNKSESVGLRVVFPACTSERRPRTSTIKKSAFASSTARSTQSRYGHAERRKRRHLDGQRDQVGVERAAGVRSDDAGVRGVESSAARAPSTRRRLSTPADVRKTASILLLRIATKMRQRGTQAQLAPDARTMSGTGRARSARERVRRRRRAPRRVRFVAPCAGGVG